jgi:hypothetical protein
MKINVSFGLVVLFVLFAFNAHSTLAANPSAETSIASSTITTQVQTEARVREYFKDTPEMIEIARCESKFRQFTDAGTVLRGGAGSKMIGVFQFFDRYHLVPAAALGFDITTVEGNLGYARHVHQTQGTTPWQSHSECWDIKPQPSNEPTNISSRSETERLEKKIQMLLQLIDLLKEMQKLRNR